MDINRILYLGFGVSRRIFSCEDAVRVGSVLLDNRDSRSAAAHLNYELKMMASLYAWTCRFDATGPALMKNACLEASLIHIRLLIEFLAGRHRPTRDDPLRRWWSPRDISPAHFVAGWTGFRDKRLDGYLELIDQYLAHLSIVRAQTIAGQAWSLEHVVDAVMLGFANFVDAVENNKSPVVDVLRSGIEEATFLKNNPPDAWPPEIPSS